MTTSNRDQLLQQYGLLKQAYSPEPFFEQTLLLASKICETPVAYISIIGDKSQYIISQYGSQFETMNKEDSICQHTIKKDEILVINDTQTDERTKSLDVTKGENRVAFYAGFPLIDAANNKLGAFCVTDTKPRAINDAQKEMLEILSKQVVSFLSLRKSVVDVIVKQGGTIQANPNTTDQIIKEIDGLNDQLNKDNFRLSVTNKVIKNKNRDLLNLTNAFPGSVAKVNRDYCYVFNNHKYEEWTGLKQYEIEGSPIIDIIGANVFNKLKPLYDRVFLGEKIITEGFFNFNKARRFLRVNYLPSYKGEEIDGALVFTEDLTEIKSYQSQLESANENLENFAHMVSHDIASPLRSIASFGYLLKRDLDKNNADYNTEYLDFIIKGAKQVNTLTTDLLAFAKAKQNNTLKTNVPVKDLLEVVQLNLFECIREGQVIINHNITDEVVHGHRSDFILLFQNFISNSIKYRRQEVSPKVDIVLSPKREVIEFNINDNGLGIPPEKQEEIFEPFKRLPEYHHIEGSGIGLATCKTIIEKYNSTITLDSKVGAGSSFSFALPIGN